MTYGASTPSVSYFLVWFIDATGHTITMYYNHEILDDRRLNLYNTMVPSNSKQNWEGDPKRNVTMIIDRFVIFDFGWNISFCSKSATSTILFSLSNKIENDPVETDA